MDKIKPNKRKVYPLDNSKLSKLGFYIGLALLIGIILIGATGCARYQLTNETITTTLLSDGSQVVKQQGCLLTITSMREVRGADIALSGDCDLSGLARGLGANQEAIQMIREIVQKVP